MRVSQGDIKGEYIAVLLQRFLETLPSELMLLWRELVIVRADTDTVRLVFAETYRTVCMDIVVGFEGGRASNRVITFMVIPLFTLMVFFQSAHNRRR